MSFPTISVSGDPVPADRQVNITVEVVEQFSERSPARLRIEFTNEASTEREFLFDTTSPFRTLVGRSGDGSMLHALPIDDLDDNRYSSVIPRSPVDGCWKLIAPYDIEGFGLRWPAGPGATTAVTYSVLADPEADDCLRPGEYRFEDEWGELLADNKDRWHLWGFTAELRAGTVCDGDAEAGEMSSVG